jgi:hypothetical protein
VLTQLASPHESFGFELFDLHVDRIARDLEALAQLKHRERLALQKAQDFILGRHGSSGSATHRMSSQLPITHQQKH